MATCPDGHQSASEDYCDVCGMRIAGAPPAGSGVAAGGTPAGSAGAGSSPASVSPGAACPQCNAPRSGVFCEACGYNFSTGAAAAPDGPAAVTAAAPSPDPPASPAAPAAPAVPAGHGSASSVTSAPLAAAAGAAPPAATLARWTAVVAADRGYYDSVEAASGPDGSGIDFPGYCPERRFQLTGTEMRIGRRSPSRGIEPEIDLTGPPTDPGISRLHAVLIATADGWAVIDPGSANGTQLNGDDLPTGMQRPLRDGDRINLGAWTTITVHAG